MNEEYKKTVKEKPGIIIKKTKGVITINNKSQLIGTNYIILMSHSHLSHTILPIWKTWREKERKKVDEFNIFMLPISGIDQDYPNFVVLKPTIKCIKRQ